MVIKNSWLCSSVVVAGLFCSSLSHAYQIEMNTAQMQAMDKITGRVSEIEVPVNGEVKFGSFSIVVRSCKATPPEETPENYAFVDVADTTKDGKLFNIFKGWMMSSSPALNAVEHPIYDVWLLKCINKSVDKSKLLSQENLLDRDGLPKKEDVIKEITPSKEAIIAEEAKAQAKALENEKAHEAEKNLEKTEEINKNNVAENVTSSHEKKSEQSLLQEEDKLPVVPEIEENKTLEKAVDPAVAVEADGTSDINQKPEASNKPQLLLPNLDDNAPKPLFNLPSLEQKTEEKANQDTQLPEGENKQPVLLESTSVQEVVAPVVLPDTSENSANVTQNSVVDAQNPQPEAEPLVSVTDENIPEEEDQFIDETISQ